MPKNLPPVMGHRVHDVLAPKNKAGSTLITRLIMATNDEACMREDQQANFNEGLNNLQQISDSSDMIGRSELFARLQIFTAMINSYRLGCGRCLNEHCKHRDPACPIKEVHDKNGHHPIGHGKTDKKK